MNAAPIAVFAFNRPDLFARTLAALAANELAEQSSLTIFCDGPRHEGDEAGTRAVRDLARHATGFASLEVVERPRNMGCAASVIDGLTEMFRRHERLIVIEDDILTSPHTLRFLNEGLERHAEDVQADGPLPAGGTSCPLHPSPPQNLTLHQQRSSLP